jgi:hypothetical protein
MVNGWIALKPLQLWTVTNMSKIFAGDTDMLNFSLKQIHTVPSEMVVLRFEKMRGTSRRGGASKRGHSSKGLGEADTHDKDENTVWIKVGLISLRN